jgi:hypothetical protein
MLSGAEPPAHPNRDPLLTERSSLDHQGLDRRDIARQPIERAQGKKAADEEGQQCERGESERPAPVHATAPITSKKLIQPSSTNSD